MVLSFQGKERASQMNSDHAVLYAEFRQGRGEPTPGVLRKFDQITRDMMTHARSEHVLAALIRAELGLPELP